MVPKGFLRDIYAACVIETTLESLVHLLQGQDDSVSQQQTLSVLIAAEIRGLTSSL